MSCIYSNLQMIFICMRKSSGPDLHIISPSLPVDNPELISSRPVECNCPFNGIGG